jgi:nitrogen fixation protein NifB
VLEAIQKEFPHFTRCVVTDGLLLPRKLSQLQEVGVSALILNVNAVDADVGAQIYSSITLNRATLGGKEAFEVLSINQLEGLRDAADAGLLVEVNATYIPGVNSEHLVEVARVVKSLGACVVNVTPLSSPTFEDVNMPSRDEMAQIRRDCMDVCASEVLIYTSPNTLSYMSSEL